MLFSEKNKFINSYFKFFVIDLFTGSGKFIINNKVVATTLPTKTELPTYPFLYDLFVSDCEITEKYFKIIIFHKIISELPPKLIKFADNKRRNHCPSVMKSSINIFN